MSQESSPSPAMEVDGQEFPGTTGRQAIAELGEERSGAGTGNTGTGGQSSVSGAGGKAGALNTAKLVLSHKPISTSSPEAMAAAQQVTPQKLAQLLLAKGPLAIRFITQALTEEIPSFKDLSASKQRRLIMGALEAGDQENSVVFAKIGWGQWSARHVKPHMFIKERELTNVANSKVKDAGVHETRRSSSNAKKSAKSGSFLNELKRPTLAAPAASIYIDENALASDDDDDDDDDEDEHDMLNYENLKRRQPSVVAVEPPEISDHPDVLFRARLRAPNGGSRRRSTSKIRSVSVSKPGAHRAPPAAGDAVEGPLRRLSPSQADRKSAIDIATPEEPPDDELLSANSVAKTRRPAARRDSWLSLSKESSIRSTLLSHSNYNIVSPPSHAQPPADHHPLGREPDHSDTDEEDWASIGAPALRNNSLPSNLSSSSSHHGNSASASNAHSEQGSPHARPLNYAIPNSVPPRQHSPPDAEDAAFLLMSLKS
ncbi:AaceriAGL152Cp [[Ashbya] aceris (nom. inval.)]|nr:AaceriAGL152Cp [[Ashbya] aceris (nom. inval.)]